MLDGRIVRGGETMSVVGFDASRADLSPAFAEYLHSFAWLRDLAAAADRKAGAPVAERAVAAWLATSSATL